MRPKARMSNKPTRVCLSRRHATHLLGVWLSRSSYPRAVWTNAFPLSLPMNSLQTLDSVRRSCMIMTQVCVEEITNGCT